MGVGLALPGVIGFFGYRDRAVGWDAFTTGATDPVHHIAAYVYHAYCHGNGALAARWFAIAPSDPATSTVLPLAQVGFPGAQASLENSEAVGERLTRAKRILREHGNYPWLTEKGNLVILNNGIEFAATYFIMLLVLFFYGAGRYLSLDYWFARRLSRPV
jgi:putative oxidoreductase